MSVYLSEEEQIQMLKKSWEKYGNVILSVVLMMIVGLVSWQWWQAREIRQTQLASNAYELIQESAAKKDETQVRTLSRTLREQFPKTSYAALSALMVARYDVQQVHYQDALNQLNWVIANGKQPAFKQIARIRAAKILLATEKPKESLAMLATIEDKVYMPLIAYVKGDSYVALGQKDEARMAYTLALQTTPASAASRSLIEMKLTELASPEAHVVQTHKGVIV